VRDIYDVVVIGGGLLGCFAARNLTRYKLKVALLEKREDLCTGISRANTAIVYSGCDTKPGTLKTSLCVKSAQEFPQLCDELGVRYSQCGSLMVCFGERGAEVLREKLEMGAENGVRGMKLLGREDLLALEPNISADVRSGLYVPDTGTVMPWELGLAAAENAARNGAEFFLNTEVTTIARNAQSRGERKEERGELGDEGEGDASYVFEVQTNNGEYYARAIVNCAGMAADSIHEMLCEPTVRIVPTAGDYYVLDTKAAGHIKHVIFHEPEEKDKGLTLVPTVDGNILVGPTERPGDDYETTSAGLEELRDLVSQVVPTLPMDHVIRSFGAVRPNPHMVAALQRPRGERREERGELGTKDAGDGYILDEKSVSDFCIVEAEDGAFVSLAGIKTPGLTCANEMGKHVADKVAAYLGADTDPAFDPHRAPPVRLWDKPMKERESLILEKSLKTPDYNKIICRCRGVSEGEIIDAIRRFPGAVTVDGVKRRTGAGSGRCQGGFCGQQVVELLARELQCPPEQITKDGKGSHIFNARNASIEVERGERREESYER